MRSASIFSTLISLGFMADSAMAQTWGELDKLRSENAILAEKLKNAQLKYAIEHARSGGQAASAPSSTRNTTGNPGNLGVSPSSMASESFKSSKDLEVLQVAGSRDDLTATIQLTTGATVNVRKGSSIPGLGLVKSISLNEVIVQGKTTTINIPFSSDSAAQSSGGMNSNNKVMMPLPMNISGN